MLAEIYSAGGEESNCNIDKEVTVFPDPDSPTMATVSPRFMSIEIFLMAEVRPESVTKSTDKFSICRRGNDME